MKVWVLTIEYEDSLGEGDYFYPVSIIGVYSTQVLAREAAERATTGEKPIGWCEGGDYPEYDEYNSWPNEPELHHRGFRVESMNIYPRTIDVDTDDDNYMGDPVFEEIDYTNAL